MQKPHCHICSKNNLHRIFAAKKICSKNNLHKCRSHTLTSKKLTQKNLVRPVCTNFGNGELYSNSLYFKIALKKVKQYFLCSVFGDVKLYSKSYWIRKALNIFA